MNQHPPLHRLTESDDTPDRIRESRQAVSEYRNTLLTASGLLITIPFLAESILVAFGHFSHSGIVLVTVPMIGSAIFFLLTIYWIVTAHRQLVSASSAEMLYSMIRNDPKKYLSVIPENLLPAKDLEAIIKEVPKVIPKPSDYRSYSSQLFRNSEQTFGFGITLLVLSLAILGFLLIS